MHLHPLHPWLRLCPRNFSLGGSDETPAQRD